MTPEFAPLQNDLIIRTAWGRSTSCKALQMLIPSQGQEVERPPMWVMRQGITAH